MKTYEEKVEIIKKRGYKSLSEFSREAGDAIQNVRSALLNKRNLTMKNVIRYANALDGDIMLALELFAEADIEKLKTGKEQD